MSTNKLKRHRRANHGCVNLTNFRERNFSNQFKNLCQNSKLFDQFVSHFSYMRISFEIEIYLHFQNPNIQFWIDCRVDNEDERRHVELFEIFNEVNQLIFCQDEDKFVSTRSTIAMFMNFFQSSAIFLHVDIVCQNVDVVHVFHVRRLQTRTIANV